MANAMTSARVSAPSPAIEALVICALAWMALAAIPFGFGGIGITWDGLNHHIYLGWTAERARFDRDVLAASFQVFQFPYANWPLYKLAVSGWSGVAAGVALATIQWLAVPAVWLIARACIPGLGWYESAFRALAVLLAFSSGLVLSLFDSTANDLIAAVPLIWAIALSLGPINAEGPATRAETAAIVFAGLLAGASVALKLSNGPLAVLLPLLWWFAQPPGRRVRFVVIGCIATGAGFTLAYAHWAWLVWQYAGDPVYPFCHACFAPLRDLLHWQP